MPLTERHKLQHRGRRARMALGHVRSDFSGFFMESAGSDFGWVMVCSMLSPLVRS